MPQPDLMLEQERIARLKKKGDFLTSLQKYIDFSIFEEPLHQAMKRPSSSAAGRPAHADLKMFKILLIKRFYGLSDANVESFLLSNILMTEFLGIEKITDIPDEKTIWRFQDRLSHAEIGGVCATQKLFEIFDMFLSTTGQKARGGQIVDATIVHAPRQHNTQSEKEALREGKIPQSWKENPHKLRQKDRDARWVARYSKGKPDDKGKAQADLCHLHFGYKNHTSVDGEDGYIRRYHVTPANAYDGHYAKETLDPHNEDPRWWGDCAFGTKANDEFSHQHGYISLAHRRLKPLKKYKTYREECIKLCEKMAKRGKKTLSRGDIEQCEKLLTSEEKEALKEKVRTLNEEISKQNKLIKKENEEIKKENSEKSKIRAKGEHPYAYQKSVMGIFCRNIGLKRAECVIGLGNILFNMIKRIGSQRRDFQFWKRQEQCV